jgi:hypothetical protein
MNAAVRWALGVGLAVIAWAVITITPDHREHTADPIPVHAVLGQTVDVSGMSLTVTDVHLSDGVIPPNGRVIAGRWVVVDLSILSRDSDLAAPLGGVALTLNDTVVTSSDLTYGQVRLDGAQLRTGLVVSGSVLFQIPQEAPLGEATLLLSRRDDRAPGVWSDDQAQLTIDLGTLPRESDLAFDAPTVRAP